MAIPPTQYRSEYCLGYHMSSHAYELVKDGHGDGESEGEGSREVQNVGNADGKDVARLMARLMARLTLMNVATLQHIT